MSVTFTHDRQTVATSVEPCLCAQGCEAFFRLMDGCDLGDVAMELASAAVETCPTCGGNGYELVDHDVDALNLANETAMLLLSILGIAPSPFGEVDLSTARRAVMRARARDLGRYVVDPEVVYGEPRAVGDVVELRPVWAVYQGISRERLSSAVARFAALVDAAGASRAASIMWA